jgi:hypothetical protein
MARSIRECGAVIRSTRTRCQTLCVASGMLMLTLACNDSGGQAALPPAPSSSTPTPSGMHASGGTTSGAATTGVPVSGAAAPSGTSPASSHAGAAATGAAAVSGSPGQVGQAGTAAVSGTGGSAAVGQAGAGGLPTGGQTGTSVAGGGSAPADNGIRFAPVTDFLGAGPFKSMTVSNTGPGGTYTIYRPDTLAPDGALNPIVGWMSGGSTNPSGYPLLPHLATHGFVVVASNTTPDVGQEVELGKEIIAGIDWVIAENQRMGSDYFGKLDETKLASMGYSMGALATFTIANDPRLTTTIHVSGGNMDPTRIKNLHAPAAFFCGIPGDSNCSILDTTCDIAAANCDTDFSNATTSVFYANFPGGHLGILTEPNQDTITTEVTAWLHWKLMLDDTLQARYVGDQCTVCKDTAHWKKVQQKNL